MFENSPPLVHPDGARFGGADAPFDQASESAALRFFDWSELTARLAAARDLRQVLRRESDPSIGTSAHDFADAAARYFRTREEYQANVNPVVLERSKGSPGSIPEHDGLHLSNIENRGLLTNGDARDD